ncbi:MAG: MFS transporter [Nitrososphaeraceae archaeon]
MTGISSSSHRIQNKAWITLVILGLTLLITMYGETMLLPGIPDIIKEFGISYDTSSWILSSYLIAGAVATPIAGRLSDIFGRKKMVTIIMMIYIIGISLGGISSNVTFLIIARVIQGIGISMFPIAFGIIRDQLPKEKLAVGVGIFSSMFAAGSVVGLALGSSIIDNFGWRTTFFSIIPIAIGLWFVIRRIIQDNQYLEKELSLPHQDTSIDRQKRGSEGNIKDNDIKSIDIKGTIALALTITSFLFVLSYSHQANAIGSYLIPMIVLVGVISLILFIIIETKSQSPLVNLQLLRNKTILSANIILVIAFLGMFTVFQTIPVMVRSPAPLGFGGNAVTSAGIQLPFMIVFLLFAPSSGYVVSKIGNIKPTIIGSIISTIGFFGLFVFHSTGLLVATNLAIVAAGLSLMQVGGFDIILQRTPKEFAGISLGMTVLFNLIGGSVGPAIAGIYMQSNQVVIKGVNGSFPSSESYSLIFLTIVLISFVPILFAFFLRKNLMSLSSQDDLYINGSGK